MPFCRKCGRRLHEYSESCPDCKTSTTGPLIKIKIKTVAVNKFKAVAPTKVAKAVMPSKQTVISAKVIGPTKTTKTFVPAKNITLAKSTSPTKPVAPAEVCPPHEIKQSNISIEEDIITNPHDYETLSFVFDYKCPHGHFWKAGRALPVSNGKPYCPKCGEQLRKPSQNKRNRYRKF